MERKDSLVILPTGYEKSLVYQTLPFIFDYLDASSTANMIIVVSPLNALMQEQVEKLSKRVNTIVIQANESKEINTTSKNRLRSSRSICEWVFSFTCGCTQTEGESYCN